MTRTKAFGTQTRRSMPRPGVAHKAGGASGGRKMESAAILVHVPLERGVKVSTVRGVYRDCSAPVAWVRGEALALAKHSSNWAVISDVMESTVALSREAMVEVGVWLNRSFPATLRSSGFGMQMSLAR